MEILVLSSKDYKDKSTNYGDCTIIYINSNVIIYDCGSEEHAIRVKAFIDKRRVNKTYIVLSHNDKDHFEGIKWLRENIQIEAIYTTLLLKYIDRIYDKITSTLKRETLKERIKDEYDNIYSLAGENLKDFYESEIMIPGVNIVGPSLEYLIEAVAKHLDKRESDMIDSETIYNAISLQLEVEANGKKILFSADSSFEAIEDKLSDYNIIQLCHHGKSKTAEKIFEFLATKDKNNEIVYFVSDNTGSSNGGSDDLKTKGRRVYNTKKNGDINLEQLCEKRIVKGSYGDYN